MAFIRAHGIPSERGSPKGVPKGTKGCRCQRCLRIPKGGGGRAYISHLYLHGIYPPPYPGPTGALWGGVRDPPPYFRVTKHKKNVLEVNWVVFRGYLPK